MTHYAGPTERTFQINQAMRPVAIGACLVQKQCISCGASYIDDFSAAHVPCETCTKDLAVHTEAMKLQLISSFTQKEH